MALKNRLRIISVLAVLAAAAFALGLRLPDLALRPMHCDEANHTVKAGILLDTGGYEYDLSDFHGPTIYYFALPVIWLSGARTLAETNEFMFRIVTVAFGVALVLLLLLVYDGLGASAVVAAALLTAVSPAMVFYSRYYIQEIVFVFFSFGAIASGWRYSRSHGAAWMIAAGVCVGLMQATKETSVLVYVSIVAGLAAIVLSGRKRDGWGRLLEGVKAWHIGTAALAAVAVCAVFITGFFSNPRGFLDAILTYLSYFKRADGAGLHEHPWHYYLQTLVYAKLGPGPSWSEGLIVGLASVGITAAFVKKSIGRAHMGFVRFLAVYTLVLTALYAGIPYKTPWCLLGFLHGMILMAGVGVTSLLELVQWKPLPSVVSRLLQAALCVGIAAGAWQLAGQAKLANGRFKADTRNPYVYAHTSSDFMRLAQRFEDVAAVAPEGHNMLVKIMTPDYWPLPWYLRKFSKVGYWAQPPADVDAAVIVTSVELQGQVKARMKGQYMEEHYGLRPEVLVTVFIRHDLWDEFIQRQASK